MKTEVEVYALIGELATKFSNLEFGMSAILEALIDERNPLTGAIVAANQSISRMLELISQISIFKFPADSTTLVEINALGSEVNELRGIRNLFIHGCWLLTAEGLENDVVACFDVRLKVKQRDRSASRLKEHRMTFDELSDYSTRVGQLVADSGRIAKGLGSMMINLEAQ